MIDIVFQLLIFFMLVASFAVQKTLDLPASQPEETEQGVTMEELEKTNIVVTVTADGSVTLDGASVALDELADALSAAVASRSEAELVLDVSDDTLHEVVVQVLDAAGAAGIQNVMFVARSGSAEGG
jgi:biopolymer transport protein ExbD